MADETKPGAAGANPNALQIQLDDDVARGIYANMAVLSHSENEFVLDFVFVPPTRNPTKVRSRVIVPPRQAKQLAASMADAVRKYESRYGKIEPAKKPSTDVQVH